jgi:hypothetical protein
MKIMKNFLLFKFFLFGAGATYSYSINSRWVLGWVMMALLWLVLFIEFTIIEERRKLEQSLKSK